MIAPTRNQASPSGRRRPLRTGAAESRNFLMAPTRYPACTDLQRGGRLLVRGLAEVGAVHRQNLVAPVQLSTAVGLSAGQDKRHKDALRLLAAHDVEAQALTGGLAQHHLAGLSENRQRGGGGSGHVGHTGHHRQARLAKAAGWTEGRIIAPRDQLSLTAR